MARTPKPKPVADPALIALVDSIGALDAELAPFKAKFSLLEAQRKLLRARYDSAAADSFFLAEGSRFQVQLGPKGNERKVNVGKLARLVGLDVLARIASVTLKALENECSGAVVCDVVTLAATGTRELTIREKAA